MDFMPIFIRASSKRPKQFKIRLGWKKEERIMGVQLKTEEQQQLKAKGKKARKGYF